MLMYMSEGALVITNTTQKRSTCHYKYNTKEIYFLLLEASIVKVYESMQENIGLTHLCASGSTSAPEVQGQSATPKQVRRACTE
jgi:hypothetical protein